MNKRHKQRLLLEKERLEFELDEFLQRRQVPVEIIDKLALVFSLAPELTEICLIVAAETTPSQVDKIIKRDWPKKLSYWQFGDGQRLGVIALARFRRDFGSEAFDKLVSLMKQLVKVTLALFSENGGDKNNHNHNCRKNCVGAC